MHFNLSTFLFTAVVAGDFNIDMMKDQECLTLAHNYGFRAHIEVPTTIKGSLLDQVFTNFDVNEQNFRLEVLPSYFSDHHLVTLCIPF